MGVRWDETLYEGTMSLESYGLLRTLWSLRNTYGLVFVLGWLVSSCMPGAAGGCVREGDAVEEQ